MSIQAPPPPRADAAPAAPVPPRPEQDGTAVAPAPAPPIVHDRQPEAPPIRTALAAGLAMMGAAFMIGGIFRGVAPRPVAAAAVAVGLALVIASVRLRRPWVQYLVVPIAALAGAVLVIHDATGEGSASLPGLISQAIHEGGISQPPIPFDPGWRFLLVVVMAVLGAGSSALAIALNRPKIGVAVPVPLAMLGELVQPAGQEVVATVGTAVFLILGLTVAYGADLQRVGVAANARFERRRMARTLALLALLAAVTTALPKLSFLFPVSPQSHVIPPQRPQIPPPPPDRPLLRYRLSGASGTTELRLGVLDTYDLAQQAWLLPSVDPARLQDLSGGHLPGVSVSGATTYSVDVRIEDQTGHVIPTAGDTQSVDGVGGHVVVDSRTQMVQTPDQILYRDLTYSVTALPPPSARALQQAAPPPKDYAEYLQAPPMPDAVRALLASAPADAYDRLQVLRNALYQHVVAAGQGLPNVDVPVSKVVSMLAGHEATPYEITAGEALLARWAGVPSRIGFGLYGGDPLPGGWFDLRPKHGATWLEVYFQGYGWLPIIGTPQQARSSTDSANQNQSATVHATEDINFTFHVPVRISSPLQYFQYVWYVVLLVLPWVLAALVLYVLIPVVAKAIRSLRRRRWASRQPPRARVLAAYASFRDVCNDLILGDLGATPFEFLDVIEPDAEHQELAWLATRALWGDLQRGIDDHDADRAAELGRSVTRRLLRAQNALAMSLAITSRASLHMPYTREVPNGWPRPRQRDRRRLRLGLSLLRRLRSPRRRPARARA